ncbi:MAG: hypothetical protein EPN56_07695 [Rhodanobacter sp.]|nr:MAG: hypothetical protein EPN66_11590 [Rhodanobacter sp.]TAM35944.1 MAG: hypothetical protein EPN56_07695 [Rhodanobacter sp.]
MSGKYKHISAVSLTSMAALLSGCVTLSGNYKVSLQDGANGGNTVILTQGSGIYTARNALCSTHPGATVVIRDATSGVELKGESPYHCR